MSGKSKKASNLVALGGAAVVAVYGAGFMRTAAAADKFAAKADERVLSAEDAAAMLAEQAGAASVGTASVGTVADSARIGNASPAPTPPAANTTAAAPHQAAQVPRTSTSATVARNGDVSVPVPPEVTTVVTSSGTTVASGGAPAASSPAPAAPAAVADKPATVSSAANSASTPTATTASAPASPPAPAPTPAPAPAATAAAAVPSAPVDPNAPVRLKDGEFTGYGTSRHGDVEVYLETTDGKITYIKISQCLTQYSCSWIADLPRQVLARQSARVDAVSGATVSANAFYYAVVAALAKAR
ncbi:MAG: FMN-binding protein [Gemmatimonas sp.]